LQRRGEIRQLCDVSVGKLRRRFGYLFDLIRRGGQTNVSRSDRLDLLQRRFQQLQPARRALGVIANFKFQFFNRD
jgi:hypothetical protein